jgi:hypothetical protein
LPAPAVDVTSLVVAPNDPATLYACTPYMMAILWRTTDTGAHWIRTDLPHGADAVCQIAIAAEDPARLVVQTAAVNQASWQSRGDSTFYLSGDRGDTLRELTLNDSSLPAVDASTWCDVQVTGRRLFLSRGVSAAPEVQPLAVLERSDDNGAHWMSIGTGLDTDSLVGRLLFGPNDSMALLALRIDATQTACGSFLSTSADRGQTWSNQGQVPQFAGVFLLGAGTSVGSQWPSGVRPLYVLEGEQISSDLYREAIFASADAHTWAELPMLPAPGVSVERRGILQALAALPDGRLAIWGVDPDAGLPSQGSVSEPMSAFWLWLWDPAARQWQFERVPLEMTQQEGCGLCWSSQRAADQTGTSYLYVSFVSEYGPTPTLRPGTTSSGLFRIRLPRHS